MRVRGRGPWGVTESVFMRNSGPVLFLGDKKMGKVKAITAQGAFIDVGVPFKDGLLKNPPAGLSVGNKLIVEVTAIRERDIPRSKLREYQIDLGLVSKQEPKPVERMTAFLHDAAQYHLEANIHDPVAWKAFRTISR